MAGATGGDGLAGTPDGIADTRLPAPRYPRESRLRREEGTVILEVDLDAEGSVTAVRVRDDAGYPRLAAAAIDAVNMGRFPPATRNGVPIASTVRIPFRFRLKPAR